MLEGYTHNPAQTALVQTLTAAFRNRVQLWNPIVWESRDPALEEKMRRDGDIRGALDLRYSLVAGRTYTIQPTNSRAHNAPMVQLVTTALLQELADFTEARKLLASACFSGARFARIEWMPRELTIGDGKLRTWLLPVRLRDADIRTYRQAPDWKPDADEVRSYWQRWSIPRGRWIDETLEDDLSTIRHIYGNRQASLGYGDGLKDALAWWWYAKTEVFAESLAAVARFAQGILTAQVRGARDAAGMPNREIIDRWRDVLEELRASNVIVYDAQDTVQHLDMTGTGAPLLEAYRRELRSTIYTLVLGANLTVQADTGGSFALGTVQKDNQDSVIQGDRDALEERLSRHLLRPLWALNAPNLRELDITDADIPTLKLSAEIKRDPAERIQVAQGASNLGLPLSQAEVYEAIDFSVPEEGEPIIEPRPAAPAAPEFGFGLARDRSALRA